MHVLVFIDLGVGVFREENGGEARYSLEGVDSGCGGVRVRGLKLGLGGGVRTMRTGAPASSAPFTVRPNAVAATGKGTFERHSHFRLSDTSDDFVCCQVSSIINIRGELN